MIHRKPLSFPSAAPALYITADATAPAIKRSGIKQLTNMVYSDEIDYQTDPAYRRAAYRFFYGCIMFSLFCWSCSKHAVVVQTAVPAAITALAKDLKLQNPYCTCQPNISQYIWRNANVYIVGYNSPACDWLPVYYAPDGKKFTVEQYSYHQFLQESKFIKTVWTCQ